MLTKSRIPCDRSGRAREALAVTRHPRDGVGVVGGRADRTHRIAHQPESAHDVGGSDLAERLAVPPDPASQVKGVDQSIGADPAIFDGRYVDCEVCGEPGAGVEVGGGRIRHQLPRERAREPPALDQIRAGGREVIHVARADHFERAAAHWRTAIVHGSFNTAVRAASAEAHRDEQRDDRTNRRACHG